MKTTFTYKTVGDLAICADVYPNPGDTICPAIIWIHGGALIMGNREGINSTQLERYLDAGYTVISIDYRLAPQARLPQIIEDIRDAHRWVRAQGAGLFKVDPERIAVVGHSAGGYLALMAGFVLDPRPQAVVSFYGYGDIAGEWYSRPSPFYNQQPAVSMQDALESVGSRVISEDPVGNRWRFYLRTRQQGTWPLEVTGFDPDREPAAFNAYCPQRNISPAYPPTLLLHGDQDTDVPYELSVQMAGELERHGVQHEFATLPGRGHGFDGAMDDPAVEAAFERVLAFLKRYV